MSYNVDFDNIINEHLPVCLKSGNIPAFVRPFLQPLKAICNLLRQKENSNNILLNHNATVWAIEKWLNGRFDPQQKRIYITDLTGYNLFVVYSCSDPSTVTVLGCQEVLNNNQYISQGFVVHIPAEYQNLDTQIEQEIKNMAFAGTIHSIVYF